MKHIFIGMIADADRQLALTGAAAERLWLLGGVTLALAGAGAVALAAMRGTRGPRD
ncbi:hypothetical protein [Streptomyces sp. NPDC093109]|uniref:hypothetical protein n=1 Tax=Streptomyces sp. NPDC093109 TaxID=3154977 RepID=UPI00344F9DB5